MTAITDRLKANLADRYRLERHLGAGGMATVYLAEDLKHHRHVALKVLRPELSALLGAERFLKEIEVTANLQHPHLLPLFDSGEADGLLFYVMPYVEGESLRQRLSREQQLSIDEAVQFTKQMASALDYAHRHGVIHRDIKPENILLHEGQALITDFGIALAVREAGGDRLTQTGLSLGTPQYMSPEQAAGDRELDPRTDIYSLACVVYEMLAGEPPHTGPTVQAVIAKLLAEPARPVTDLRPTVPVHIAAALDMALSKLPADRFARVEEFAQALASSAWFAARIPDRATSAGPVRPDWRQRAAIPLVGLAVVLALVAAWSWTRARARETAPGIHAMIPTARPVGDPIGQFQFLSISPDGRLLAYSQPEGIVLRPLASLSTTVIPNTVGARFLTFSPDGQQLAFAGAGRIFRTSVAGGTRTDVAGFAVSGGLHWGADNYLYFAGSLGTGGIWRVGVGGGDAERVTSVRDEDNENAHTWPQLLPGGKAILYTALGPSGGATDSRVIAQRLDSPVRHVVVENAIYGRYLPTGHLLYARDDGTLYAVRFDPSALEVTGEPVAIQDGVGTATWGGAAFVEFSNNGTEIYLPRSDWPGYAFVFADRSGRFISSAVDTTSLGRIGAGTSLGRLSPVGARIALNGRKPGLSDVWVVSGPTSTARLTLDPAEDESPAWSPDGRSVAYTSAQTGTTRRIFVRDVSSGAQPRLVTTWPRHVHVTDWSPDGQWLALSDFTARGQDVWAVSLDGKDSIVVAMGNPTANNAVFSSDGRWLAYMSYETDRPEVFVVSFPGMAIRRQVSTSGATTPRWDRRGYLYYLSNGNVVARSVDVAGSLSVGGEAALFRSEASSFDISPDGQRFLLQVPNTRPGHPPLHVRTNWFDEIKATVK